MFHVEHKIKFHNFVENFFSFTLKMFFSTFLIILFAFCTIILYNVFDAIIFYFGIRSGLEDSSLNKIYYVHLFLFYIVFIVFQFIFMI